MTVATFEPWRRPGGAARRWALAVACVATMVTVGAGCTDELVEPDCDTALELVMRGEVDERVVRLQQGDVEGRWMDEKFYVQLADPLEGEGTWILEFGYNPLLDELGFVDHPGLANDMQQAPSQSFTLLHRDPDPSNPDVSTQRCDPRQGELCAGLGMYDRTGFDPRQDIAGARPYQHYMPVRSGRLQFHTLTGVKVHATYEVELDWDLEGQGLASGTLRGCFHAARRPAAGGDGDVLE